MLQKIFVIGSPEPPSPSELRNGGSILRESQQGNGLGTTAVKWEFFQISTCCSPIFTFHFILVLQIVNPLDSRLAKNFAANRQFWSKESLWILHVTAGRVELLWNFRFVEKLRMVWCSIPGNLLTFSSARPVSEDWCQLFFTLLGWL